MLLYIIVYYIGPTWGPQGQARAQKGKIWHVFFIFLAKMVKNGEKKVNNVICRKKKYKSRIVGQKCQKKKVLRMGLPGTQKLS